MSNSSLFCEGGFQGALGMLLIYVYIYISKPKRCKGSLNGGSYDNFTKCNHPDHPCHLSACLHCDDTTLPQGGNSRAKKGLVSP